MDQHERRREVVRQFLLDLELYSGSLLETRDAVHYLRWNFEMYLKEALEHLDKSRKLSRVMKSQREFGDYTLSAIESGTVSLTIGLMGNHIRDPKKFEQWLFIKFLSPILAEEDRYLDQSDPREVWTVGGICGTASLSSNKIVFKAWESVLFPNAKDVPPRFEPSPDEKAASVGKME